MNFSRRPGQDEEPEISVVPLIDVIFVLIVFFVITTTFDQRSAIQLRLPQAEAAPQAQADNPLVLVIDAEGRYFLGGNEVLRKDAGALREAIRSLGAALDNGRAVLRADARAPHQTVVTALDALGQAGYDKISIATVGNEAK
ncbi:MAG: biopolymer transporter ExbD [Lysobacteraceae bacterium]